MTDLRRVLALAVSAERTRADLTQDQLADRLGWTRSVVSKIEGGSRTIGAHELPAICGALGIDLARLMLDADPEDRARLGI